jgi:hypothetical protein
VVVAEEFDQLRVGLQDERGAEGPGFRVRFRIVDGDLQIHVADVEAAESLDHSKGIAVRVGFERIEPPVVLESGGLDDKRLSVPAAHGVSEPGRLGRRRQRTPVGEDLPEGHPGLRFVEDRRHPRRLQDLEWPSTEIDAWRSWRQAIAVRIVDVIAAGTLRLNRCRPCRHSNVFRLQVLGEIEEQTLGEARIAAADATFSGPDARQIGLAVS